jgi:dephospho-CoA kinase
VLLVGLTGGIAAGKSTVAARLVQRGVMLIDADAIAREVVEPGTSGFAAIVERFGSDILLPDGSIDRPALGRVVFADPEDRADLNAITHPRVAEEIASRLAALADFPGVVVVDVPLLVEAQVDRGYQAIVVVAARPAVQLQRLIRERGMPEADARARIAAQASLEERLARATHVIWNEGTLEELHVRTDEVADELLARAAALH